MKKIVAFIMVLVMSLSIAPMKVLADSATVVTIGANLTDAQRATMFKYFGVEESKVNVIEVTNAEEREYLVGVATEAQIGRKTYSCAYIQETEKGNGINVKIANLNVVDSAMIATTLTTAGIYNCNVVAAAPFEVSGTGALTGIIKAFEKVTGEALDEEKKELATEELVTTTELAEELKSKDSATGLMTAVKEEVIKTGATSDEDITKIIKDVAKAYGIDLTDDQIKKILEIMKKVSEQDYDYDKIKSTLSDISNKAAEKLDIDLNVEDLDINISSEDTKGIVAVVKNFFESVGEFFVNVGKWFVGLFGGGSNEEATSQSSDSAGESNDTENKDLGILNNTDDSILGDGVIINSTDESTINSDTAVESKEEADSDVSKGEDSATTDEVEKTEDSTTNDETTASEAPTEE